jgi:diguanylate cyclase (GGDEF)-like protein/PAS domain S-box-containing protein
MSSDASMLPSMPSSSCDGTAGEVAHLMSEGAGVGLLAVSASGIILGCNAATGKLLGRDPAVLVNTALAGLQPPPATGLALLFSGQPAQAVETRRILPFVDGAGTTVTLDATTRRVQRTPESAPLYIVTLREADLPGSLDDGWNDADRRLRALTQNLPGIVFQRVLQPNGTIYYPFFSSGVTDILGYDPDAMRVTAEGVLDCIHWADRDGYMDVLRKSAVSLEPASEAFRAITSAGEVKWLSGMARPERMPTGDILWDGVLIDVTERMRAEHRLDMIMDHAADCVITMNVDSRIETVNAATVKAFGYTAEDLIGADVGMLMTEGYASEHRAFVEQYLATGGSSMIGRGPRELLGQRKDGAPFPIELSLSEVLTEGRRLFIAIVRDITQRKETEARLHETEQRLLTIADNIQGIVFQRMMTADGALRFSYVSEGCRAVLGVDPDDLIADGDMFLDLLNDMDRGLFIESVHRSADSLEPMEADIQITSRTGDRRWLRSWSRPRRLADDTIVWDGVALDVTDRKRVEEELMFLAYYDPITGLGNRSMFNERFNRARDFAQRLDSWVAVLSIGIDRFSIVNATLGHSTGDKVLLATGRRIKDCMEAGDLVCRAGGDRFLAMIAGVSDGDGMAEAVRVILRGFESPLTVDGQEFDITVSVGAALFPRDAEDVETLIMHSEAALHRAKVQGPASFQAFTEEMGQRAQNTMTMQHRLRRALDNEEFVAFFQPQVQTRTGRIVGMEALVRWMSPEHGMIPPGAFIEVAEEFGLIDAMCEQVLRDSCRWNRRWQELGLAQVPVAVNISGRQFHNARLLLGTVDSVLRECNLDPAFLELELTESSAMSDPDNAIRVVRQLVDRGIACAIDDFGTGYSSLSVLKRFPIQKLKIDRSFVSEVTVDPGDAAIVCAMIAMANALNLKVVAEGVETQEHLDFLHGVGCDQVQGYLMSRPLPGEAMEALFRDPPVMPTPA